jgi:hypothetical protein
MKKQVKFFKEEDGTILAVFVTEPYYRNGDLDNVVCYSHVGQHSCCSKEYYESLSLAEYPEYRSLLDELFRIGYTDLSVYVAPLSLGKGFKRPVLVRG